MAQPSQPVQIGTEYAVNFSGGHAPTTTGYMPEDGWTRTNAFALKGTVEDLAGNPVNRTFGGKEVIFEGTLFVPAGTAPSALKPGDTFSLTPIVLGEVTGTAVIYCIRSVTLTGNRLHDKLQLTVVKENSMTYTLA
jgi:hypothetical protein